MNSDPQTPQIPGLTRRRAVGAAGAAGAALLLSRVSGPDKRLLSIPLAEEAQAAAGSCVLNPAKTEGPYFVDEKLNRSDIRTDPGDGTTARRRPACRWRGPEEVRPQDREDPQEEVDRMPSIGPMEMLLILGLALLVLGPKRLPDAGRAMGRGMREFKDAVTGMRAGDQVELAGAPPDAAGPAPQQTKPAAVA